MSTIQAVINNENMFKNSKLNTQHEINSFSNGFDHAGPTISSTQIYPKNLEEQFRAACETIQSLPKNGSFQPSNEMLLKFYGYFKQATVGPCKTSRPGIFKVVERAKYDAWYSVRDLNKEQAMQGYIDEIKKIIETMPHNEFVQKLINIIGPFYEFVDEKNQVVDTNQNDVDENDDEKKTVIENKNYALKKTTSFDSVSNGINASSTKEQINGLSMVNNHAILKKNYENKNSNENGITNGKVTVEKKLNGISDNFQTNEITSEDDDEDFCDTSDYINEQEIIIQKQKNENKSDLEQINNRDYNYNKVSDKLNGKGFNGHEKFDQNLSSNHSNLEVNHVMNNNSNFAFGTDSKFSPIIHKFGGEMNSPPGNLPFNSQNQSRYSRPGSSQSMGHGQNRYGQSSSHNHGAGGGMGGGGQGNENFLAQDTNRQILLILLRLQQDTSNVLTRLSYLESSVLSLQSNKYENGLQINEQMPSAFSVVSSPQNRTRNSNNSYGFLIDMIRNIDWKTVAVSILWPFIIRLVFYILKKFRLFM
ncbi:acyl- -binding domain-containing 5 isoform X4 [Brachionus plicatilis]|uniref:Acyl--binding domain-containing 5 isoform X4 n=1 Tax=Brachionus plicatilis TaxID=10195 RepID=A0A3M7QFH5_BRAPC|nr:acyl- -binding domain-containing 5 isoform X4 [Brachionus plicatilis]